MGDVIGQLGHREVNGHWTPHLHLQLLTDLCAWDVTDIAGITSPGLWPVMRSVSPDPNLLLRLPVNASRIVAGDPTNLLSRRQRRLGKALSLAYRQPLKIVRGEGCHLYDESGRAYLDMVNNVCHVGHCHPRVVEAGQRQMRDLNTNTRYLHDNIVEYIERLAETLPPELSCIYLVNSGSEANDLALRLARAYTGNRDVVTVDHAYHGHLTSLIGVSPYKFNGKGGEGCPDDVWVAEMPDLYRGRWRYEEPNAGALYAAAVQGCIDQMAQRHRRPALFFSEAILGTGGQLTLPADYLRQAFAHIRAAGGLCLSDEVQIGFGRVGSHMWAFETQGVIPDIITMGKPIANGHPMAAVATRPEIAAAFANGMEYFNTFGGNPVSSAMALAVLDVIRDERLMQNAATTGGRLIDGLRKLAKRHSIIGDVRGQGLFLGVELVRDRVTLEPAADELSRVIEAMKQRQVLLSTEGPHHNVLKIKPPIVFNAAHCDEFLAKLDVTLSEL
jgi:4-aminobutyrate aminotransferase-like enzyme